MAVPAQDVAILGGGVAGWSLAYELAESSISSAVFDTDPCARFSTTGNQGWLHTGAYYAGTVPPDEEAAKACNEGYGWIRSRFPNVIDSQVDAYYLFRDDSVRQTVIDLCQTWKTQWGMDPLPQVIDFSVVAGQEALVSSTAGNPKLKSALQVNDHPINTTKLIEELSARACNMGVQYYAVPTLPPGSHASQFVPAAGFPDWNGLSPHWTGTHWELRLPNGTTAEFSALVLACGVAIPDLLPRLTADPTAPTLERKKVPVLVIQGKVAASLLAIPGEFESPQVVPYDDGQGSYGATVCLHRTDLPMIAADDFQPPVDYMSRHQTSLRDWLRGIVDVVCGASSFPTHFYVCQKLLLPNALPGVSASRTFISLALSAGTSASRSLFVLYPGKMTAAPIAAKHCVGNIQGLLSNTQAPVAQALPDPPVARQRALEPSTSQLACHLQWFSGRRTIRFV